MSECIQDDQPRLRVETSEGGATISWKYQQANEPLIKEICQRINLAFRTRSFSLANSVKFDEYPAGVGETQSVCVVWHPTTYDIQVVTTGLTKMQACMTLDHVIAQIDHIMMHPE